jgi:long-subunit fatty acid transport protein
MLAEDQVRRPNISSRNRIHAFGAVLALTATNVHAQAPAPSPLPNDRLAPEKEAVLRGRASVDVGSGARAYGMGGAFLARADDATAASWNPAGLSYLRRPELSLVGARTSFAAEEVRPTGFVTKESGNGRVADFVAATYPVTLGPLSGSVQLSYQRVITFTDDRREETPDVTRTAASEGGFDVVALGTGFRVFNSLRVGGTLNRWTNGYTQTFIREPVFGRTRGRVDQTSDYEISGWNANVGLIWEPFQTLNFGLVGKTPFTADVSLRRERTDFSPSTTAFTRNNSASDAVRLDLPGAIGVGASWRPVGPLTVSADYTRTRWSRARIRNFFTLAPTPEGEDPGAPEETGDFYDSLSYPTFTTDTDAADTVQIRAGVEYVLIHDRVRWPVRAGYFRNRQTFPASDGDSPWFNGATLGVGMGIGPLMLDVAFVYEAGDYVDQEVFLQSVDARRVLFSLIYRHLGR